MTDNPISSNELQLGHADRGFVGTILRVDASRITSSLPSHELEQQLVEMGFLEGARVEILHEGTIKRDPIAVRIDNITIALRRSEAMAVFVESAVLVESAVFAE